MSSEFATPANLPLLVSGWGAGRISFATGEDFWRDAFRFAAEGNLGEELDRALGGRSAPRVWAILHEPGEWALAAATALGFARELAGRDQAVILLDGDEGQAAFTRQASAEEGLGWVDMIRYGSGVSECGLVLPFAGRQGYFVGVGAYSPSEPTAEEITGLLRRLQRQADDVIVCAPADAIGRRWAAQADLRLLCWDRSERAAGLVEELAGNLTAAEQPLTGLVGYGLPSETEPHLLPEEDVEAVVEEKVVEQGEAAPSAADILQDLEKQDEEHQEDAEMARREEEFARRKGSSRLFGWVAAAAVLLIAVSAFYYIKYLHVPSDGLFPSAAEETQSPTVPAGVATHDSGLAASEALEDENPQGRDAAGAEGSLTGEPLDTGAAAVAPAEEPPVVPEPGDSGAETAAGIGTETGSETVGEIESDPGIDSEVTSADPEPTRPVFDITPYTHAPGEAGWALHVYSFPDTSQARQMQQSLAARGIQSDIRAVEIKDKGRWYRIYLGSFPDMGTALAARDALLEKLGEKWAGAVRVR